MTQPDPVAMARSLTGPQRRALAALPVSPGALSPAELGAAMGGTRSNRAQGLGRLGGTMGSRLERLGLANGRADPAGFPAYRLTEFGERVLAALRSHHGDQSR